MNFQTASFTSNNGDFDASFFIYFRDKSNVTVITPSEGVRFIGRFARNGTSNIGTFTVYYECSVVTFEDYVVPPCGYH
jgi:hypothetical protein